MSQLFIGIDSGTQSTRAVLVDGDTGAASWRAHAAAYDIPAVRGAWHQGAGSGRLGPRGDRHGRAGVLDAAGAEPPDAVAGIGISGQQHGFVPLDAEGHVIRPAKLWCDTSDRAAVRHDHARGLGGLTRTIELLGQRAFLPASRHRRSSG